MFMNPAQGSGSEEPSALSASELADLQKVSAPKTPPKNPGPKPAVSNMAAILIDDEQLFQATQRSSLEQLQEHITQRAGGRNAVDFYEEGMIPLLSYMFFVLHYHENFLTNERLQQ